MLSKLSKALLFLSRHKAQNIHNEAAFRAFFLLLPTKDLCQLRRTSLTEQLNTDWIPKCARINCHNKRAFEQCMRIWSLVSSPLFELIQSQNLGPSCFPSKEANSWGHPRIPNNTMGERFHWTKKAPSFVGNHTMASSVSTDKGCVDNLPKKACTSSSSQSCSCLVPILHCKLKFLSFWFVAVKNNAPSKGQHEHSFVIDWQAPC